jgi:16S rRNA (cytosine1402-N4)-methyltransferase
MNYHTTVLLKEAVDALDIQPDGVYVDATFGGGGHSNEILSRLGANGRLIAFDQDEAARQNLAPDTRLTFVAANFRNLQSMLRLYGVRKVDGILADLGVSSHQFDEAARGFSYRFDAPLDMRMNRAEPRTAADIVNTYSATDLQRILGEYGEVRNARTLANAIVTARTGKKILNISDLLQITQMLAMGEKMRYQSQVFQALRIEVNDELGALAELLAQVQLTLQPVTGRVSIITFHSLEDRLVKNFFKSGNIEGVQKSDFYGNIERPFEILTKKPILPSETEIRDNPRARSAKLRVAQLKAT